jgi:hypothetical protein
VFHYGYPDSLFAAIVLYVPILSVLATSIYILCKKLYWLFSGFFIGIFAAIIITLGVFLDFRGRMCVVPAFSRAMP